MINIPYSDLMTIIITMLIVIIALSLIIVALSSRKNYYKAEMYSFAGGVERAFDFLYHKKLIREYKKYSLNKFGEKRQDPTPPPPKKEY